MPLPEIHPAEIRIKDFKYDLPDERIARYPLPERDLSKLLVYKNNEIWEDIYRNLADHIPAGSLLLFNQAKVIHARLYFQKQTGGRIEIFCLEPDERYADITTAMMQEGKVYWKCLLKGASKWKDGQKLSMKADYQTTNGEQISFYAEAEKITSEGQSFTILFTWKTNMDKPCSFSEFLEHTGKIPIPPYLKRDAEDSDEVRYQTIFAKEEGSVAAPTAALHFTPYILEQLSKKAIDSGKLTLHVGAGTFMPVKSEKMEGHEMHYEWIAVTLPLLERIDRQLKENKKIITVGTTSARTLESLYWIGVQVLRGEWNSRKNVAVTQWYPYLREDTYSGREAIEALINYFRETKMEQLITKTQLIIAPGYAFKLLDGMVTNFHQPASTLLLMIAALVGEDWHQIYNYALSHNFRFLSYGDGSLLWRQ